MSSYLISSHIPITTWPARVILLIQHNVLVIFFTDSIKRWQLYNNNTCNNKAFDGQIYQQVLNAWHNLVYQYPALFYERPTVKVLITVPKNNSESRLVLPLERSKIT